jgi:calcineurin-like phosphoesterase family protein
MSRFVTADLHFGHKRMREMRNEWEKFIPPVATVEEMDEWIIAMWNGVVEAGDEVWVVGDVSFAGRVRTAEILARLNGSKILVPGNHDHDKIIRTCEEAGWKIASKLVETRFDDRDVVLCHYPLYTWRNAHHGAWHLHGHCHGSLRTGLPKLSTQFDVGIDTHFHFEPYAWSEIAGELMRREYIPVDHHVPRPH